MSQLAVRWPYSTSDAAFTARTKARYAFDTTPFGMKKLKWCGYEAQPDDPVAITAQTQQFKQDITRHNSRSIHYYCLIGRNLNALKIKNSLTPAACALHYSPSHIRFLINLYKLSSFYPKIKRVTVRIRELKTNFKALKEGVSEEKEFWKQI